MGTDVLVQIEEKNLLSLVLYFDEKSVLTFNFDFSTFLCCQGSMRLLLTSIRDADLQVDHSLLFV